MSPLVGLVVTVMLVGVNAFFVAGEFATTSTRRSQIEPLYEQGVRGSAQAMFALEHVSLMLAICQLGVTIASTTLGAVAEPAIAHVLHEPFTALGLPTATAHAVAFVIALLLVVFLHVVFGEMIPKNISIAMPHRALLLLAPPLEAFGRALRVVIEGMDQAANWFVRRAGLTPRAEISAAFTVEEVASIVELSQREGTIHDDLGLLSGSLEFSEKTAGDAMVALDELVLLPADCTPAMVEHEVALTGYSRYPVADEDGTILGYLHLKDVLYAEGEERDRPVDAWRIRRMEQINAADEVEDALRRMQRSGTHCAEVIDEGGDVLGVLFLEDLLEELVGEVRDSLQRDT